MIQENSRYWIETEFGFNEINVLEKVISPVHGRAMYKIFIITNDKLTSGIEHYVLEGMLLKSWNTRYLGLWIKKD